MTHRERVQAIDLKHQNLSVERQADLLDISRSSIYYKRVVGQEDLKAMRAIDEIFTKSPFYGSRKIKSALAGNYDIFVGRHHVRRLMRLMGLETIYPKHRSTSTPNKDHKKYPYLLNGLSIVRPNQVHGTDITYIRLDRGFCYLIAHLDWFSRFVLAWELSESLEAAFCVNSLTRALERAVPEIHNSDQGCQFTGAEYLNILESNKVQISMDGRGRCFDNIFTERLWRTVKYEDIYLKSYRTTEEVRRGLTDYFQFYNTERVHQALNYRTPASVYFGSQ